MKIRHSIDEAHRVLLITIAGPVTGPDFVAYTSRLYGERADLFAYDCVVDLREYDGDIGYADLDGLQMMYAQATPGAGSERPGFIVTSDPNFHLWASALDAQFPGRKHYVTSSLEAAFAGLERLRTAAAA